MDVEEWSFLTYIKFSAVMRDASRWPEVVNYFFEYFRVVKAAGVDMAVYNSLAANSKFHWEYSKDGGDAGSLATSYSEIISFDYIADKDVLKTELLEPDRAAVQEVLNAIDPNRMFILISE